MLQCFEYRASNTIDSPRQKKELFVRPRYSPLTLQCESTQMFFFWPNWVNTQALEHLLFASREWLAVLWRQHYEVKSVPIKTPAFEAV